MFPNQQPSDVSEEEAAAGVVRIGVCFTVLVMNAMVSSPFDDRVLLYEIKNISTA